MLCSGKQPWLGDAGVAGRGSARSGIGTGAAIMGQGRFGRRAVTRRSFIATSVGALALTAGGGLRGRGAAAQDVQIVDPDDGTRVSTLGEAAFPVFVPETEHTVSGIFLDYWRATGADTVFGNPVSEPFTTADDRYLQVFERAVLEYRPEFLWTVDPFVRLLPAAKALLARDPGALNLSGRRMLGGANRDRMWAPVDASAVDPVDPNVLYVAETEHTVRGAFLDWYREHEGDFYLGAPLSEAFDEDDGRAQWFECGKLVETADGAELARLGPELAKRLNVPTAGVAQGGAATFDETLFWTAPSPFALTDPAATGRKHIHVDITNQALQAFQGGSVAMDTLISTGLWPNKTEVGRFRVRYKSPSEDMRGATDSAGHVVWVSGDGGKPPAGSIPYGVPDVPSVMYVNLDAEALHGAYWHHNFGHTMSHGCINQPLDVAAFMYGWAPLGTPVTVFLQPGHVYPGSESGIPASEGPSGS